MQVEGLTVKTNLQSVYMSRCKGVSTKLIKSRDKKKKLNLMSMLLVFLNMFLLPPWNLKN